MTGTKDRNKTKYTKWQNNNRQKQNYGQNQSVNIIIQKLFQALHNERRKERMSEWACEIVNTCNNDDQMNEQMKKLMS